MMNMKRSIDQVPQSYARDEAGMPAGGSTGRGNSSAPSRGEHQSALCLLDTQRSQVPGPSYTRVHALKQSLMPPSVAA